MTVAEGRTRSASRPTAARAPLRTGDRIWKGGRTQPPSPQGRVGWGSRAARHWKRRRFQDAAARHTPPQPSPEGRESGRRWPVALGALIAATLATGPALASVLGIVRDSIPASLTGAPGDPVRGRAIVVARQKGLCLLCHSGPFPEERFQGDLAPSLAGAGSRWSEGQLRLRIADAGRLNPDTIMPTYGRSEGFTRVAPAFRGKPVLSPAEIEDVVAFLATLRE